MRRFEESSSHRWWKSRDVEMKDHSGGEFKSEAESSDDGGQAQVNADLELHTANSQAAMVFPEYNQSLGRSVEVYPFQLSSLRSDIDPTISNLVILSSSLQSS